MTVATSGRDTNPDSKNVLIYRSIRRRFNQSATSERLDSRLDREIKADVRCLGGVVGVVAFEEDEMRSVKAVKSLWF